MFSEINNQEFSRLKADIEAYHRLCGYYIISLVSIRDCRANGIQQEMILEKLIDHFENDSTEFEPDFVPDYEWGDYETTLERARTHAIESLVGGRQIGHIDQTMSESIAGELFDRLVMICGANPRFYIGFRLGDRTYVFMYGVLVLADNLAGILWIIEDD